MGADRLIDPAQVAAALAPLDDLRASAIYRAEAATELLRRCLNTTIQTAGAA
jgi:xanthine dehydrogenase iron-sulfur cluster and FAD-binding subunit A